MKKLSIIIIMLVSCIVGCSKFDPGDPVCIPMRNIKKAKTIRRFIRTENGVSINWWEIQFREEFVDGHIPEKANKIGPGLYEMEVQEVELQYQTKTVEPIKRIIVNKVAPIKEPDKFTQNTVNNLVKEPDKFTQNPVNMIAYNGMVKTLDKELSMDGNVYIITVRTLSGDLVIKSKDVTLYREFRKGDEINLKIHYEKKE